MDENTTAATSAAETTIVVKANEKTFVLPNGSQCTVRRAKGIDSMKASDIALVEYGKEPSAMQIMNCIISLVTTIDGNGILPKELEQLWAEDYAAIQGAYMEISGGL